MKIAVYTAVIPDNFDTIKEHVKQSTQVDFYKFTTPLLASNVHSRLQAKYYKLQPHLIPPLMDYDIVIWIDGSATITSPDFVKWVVEELGDDDIALFKHPENRDCIYQEAEYCMNMPKYQGQKVKEQAEYYRSRVYLEHNGLWACGMMVYRMNRFRTEDLLNMWWRENLKWTYQDQLSFPYVKVLSNARVHTIDANIFDNSYIHFNRDHSTNL